MYKIKMILSVSFIVIGLVTAFLTFNMSNRDSYGSFKHESGGGFGYGSSNQVIAGSGVDSSNDGVAVGLGIISGFAFLSSALLLSSLKKENI